VKILCTFPGKIGDALWSLPTVRMISRHFGTPVDFAMSTKYGQEGLLRLIGEQEYVGKAFVAPGWDIVDERICMMPRELEVDGLGYDRVFHLGYPGWPQMELAQYVWSNMQARERDDFSGALDMAPWIKVSSAEPPTGFPQIYVGWNQEWLELKMVLANS